jgi:hypothetical protein
LTNAGALGVLFIAFRNDDLSMRTLPLALGWHKFPDIDAPAWWLLKKKKTMYCDGGMAAESTRSIMQFLLVPGRAKEKVTSAEPVWDDIRRYILSIEPPKYPFAIDRVKAARGKAIFAERCVECHGTYGEKASYPNRIVPIEEIGTDRARYDAITDAALRRPPVRRRRRRAHVRRRPVRPRSIRGRRISEDALMRPADIIINARFAAETVRSATIRRMDQGTATPR